MSAELITTCRYCGQPRRIDTWCASDACAERVQEAQRELHELIFGASSGVSVEGNQPVKPQVGKFTLAGRLRMAFRRLHGKPQILGVQEGGFSE